MELRDLRYSVSSLDGEWRLWYPNMFVYVFLCSLQEVSVTICDLPDTVIGSLKAETYFMDLLLCFDKARGGLVKDHMQYGGIGGVIRCFLSLEEPGREMDTS